MSITVVKNCSCMHEYQDKKYGKGKRIHNVTIKGTTARCTVCGNVK